MALDKSKLKSYMQQVEEDSAYPDYEEEGEESETHEAEEEAAEELEEAGAEGDYEGFMELMFQHAAAIQHAASSVYVTALDAIDDDVKSAINEAIAGLPEDLAAGIKQFFADMEPDQLHEVIENLEEAGAIENDASVVPFLYWAARAA